MDTLTLSHIKKLLPPRLDNSHKMTFGHVLNIAGSINYRGAAYLSSLSALRVGAGYVTLASSPSVCHSVCAQTPNVVTLPLLIRPQLTVTEIPWFQDHFTQQKSISSTNPNHVNLENEALAPEAISQLLPKLTQTNVISLGSGLSLINSQDQNTTVKFDSRDSDISRENDLSDKLPQGNFDFFCALIKTIEHNLATLVLDADGLNFLAYATHTKTSQLPIPIVLPTNSLFTPHPKELSRLLAVDVSAIQTQRVHYATLAAKRFNAVIVLKGQHTVITDGTQVFINPTGNSALAKAGTGDVLTGMIAGFCAQGMTSLDAACLSVYLHGLAGELAATQLSSYSLLASELIDYIPKAIQLVLKHKD